MRALLPVLAAALALPAACATEPADPLAPVTALIGDAACDHSSQCRTVAIGAKACGGPEAFLAWSTRRTDAKALEAAVAAQGRAQVQDVPPGRRVSNCQFVADPGAACVPAGSGRACTLQRADSRPAQ